MRVDPAVIAPFPNAFRDCSLISVQYFDSVKSSLRSRYLIGAIRYQKIKEIGESMVMGDILGVPL